MSTINELFGITLPILQAPMAGVQGSALAVAVSAAGGLGALPGAMLPPEALRNELQTLVGASSSPYNVNFFCHTVPAEDPAGQAAWRALLRPYYVELGLDLSAVPPVPERAPFSRPLMDILANFRPPVVSFHFGLPAADLMRRIRSWGGKIIASATTVDEARWLEQRGVDAIVAQGVEAGGHRGMFLSTDLSTQVETAALLPQVVRAVRVPVIAAGGIATAADVAGALAMGAAGVQVGTSYLLSHEATTSGVHRAALAGGERTALTNIFTGRPARSIINRFIREIGPINPIAPPFPRAFAAVAPLRAAAEARGSGDFSPLWAGTKTDGCRAVSAAEITRQLASRLG